MDRMHRRFEELLDHLAEKVLRLGGLVEEAIGRATRALVERDSAVARQVVEEDEQVDRLELEIDQLCMELLALRQPMARDLRFITTAMKVTADLERMADLAVNVSERAIELNDEPQLKPFIDLPIMARIAQEMLRGALDALVRRDARAAREIIRRDDELDERMEQIFRELLSFMIEDARTIGRAIRLSFIAKYFERMGDQTTNICEQVVYMVEARVIKHAPLDGPAGAPAEESAG